MQISFLILRTQHVHHFPVLRGAGGALGLALCKALQAVLMERVAAQEVHRWQL